MDAARRRALIEQYKDGYRAVREALDQLAEEELDARPADGWTPREIAHHLADSETMSYLTAAAATGRRSSRHPGVRRAGICAATAL